jgi:phenylpyruvate tautomerase PptA (4-oxalocrotonate tautomerase family)
MPVVKVNVPDWASREQMQTLHGEVADCIAKTWAKQHIWVALQPMYAPPKDATVMLTVDLRDGRGQEAERTQALFDLSLKAFERVLGTTEDKLIVLVRKFEQDEAVSGGGRLPPLSELTPDLAEIK